MVLELDVVLRWLNEPFRETWPRLETNMVTQLPSLSILRQHTTKLIGTFSLKSWENTASLTKRSWPYSNGYGILCGCNWDQMKTRWLRTYNWDYPKVQQSPLLCSISSWMTYWRSGIMTNRLWEKPMLTILAQSLSFREQSVRSRFWRDGLSRTLWWSELICSVPRQLPW